MRLYTSVNYEIICKAAAARLTFLLALATQHVVVKLQGLQRQDVARVTRGRFCNKIAETMFRIFIELNFCNMLQMLGQPAYWCNHLRLLSQNSFEDVKLPVRVENCRCRQGLKLRVTRQSYQTGNYRY